MKVDNKVQTRNFSVGTSFAGPFVTQLTTSGVVKLQKS